MSTFVEDLQLGDLVRSTWTIKLREDSSLVDPGVLIFIVKRPDLTEHLSVYGLADQPYPITRVSQGVYYANIPLIDIVAPEPSKAKWGRRWLAYDELGGKLKAHERFFAAPKSLFDDPLPDYVP